MSFEGTKKRLVDEFAETQAAVRAEFGMKAPDERPRADRPRADRPDDQERRAHARRDL